MQHLANFTHLMRALLHWTDFSKHRQLLLSKPGSLEAVADLLLRYGVPGFAAAATSSSSSSGGSSGGVRLLDTARPGLECMSVLEALCAVLGSSTMQAAVASYLRQPGGPACLQHAISIVVTLPASPLWLLFRGSRQRSKFAVNTVQLHAAPGAVSSREP
jgi:hypothetical protein